MFSYRIDDNTELRFLEERDAVEFHTLNSTDNAHMKTWLPAKDTEMTLEGTSQFIKDRLQEFADNKGVACGVWYKGKLAGYVDAQRIHWGNRTMGMGYWLGTSFEGKGLMTKACRALIKHAIHELGINRVEIACATENLKSRAIPERLGFTQEGVLRQAEWLTDHYVDHVVYGLLAEDWQKKK